MNPRKYQNPPSRPNRFRLAKDSILTFSNNSRIGPGFYLSVAKESSLAIGKWTNIGADFTVHCRLSIKVGHRCLISHGVTFMDYDGHYISHQRGKRGNRIESSITDTGANLGRGSPIVIGDDVWIGLGATILKGVKIGEGSVIAAGTRVVRDVLPFTLVAGNPARAIRKNVRWRHF
ncbi:MAG: acetyltransferase [Bdellovibrio sp.]|nr:MAG: acetyltransferase [Bdellovibrio sp.]